MPVYEFACDDHGTFEVVRPISRFRDAASCPECDAPGQRLLSAPHLASLPLGTLAAHERNERSRHEPRVAACSHGHSHCRGHHQKPDKRTGKPKLQAYNGPRPWVLEHA